MQPMNFDVSSNLGMICGHDLRYQWWDSPRVRECLDTLREVSISVSCPLQSRIPPEAPGPYELLGEVW